jgi:hypothetical protein
VATLLELAAEASKSPEWADYTAFCVSRERGLRREAFRALERFIASLESTPFYERQRFVSWLMHITDDVTGLASKISEMRSRIQSFLHNRNLKT